jgi:hypothetical protein
MCAAVHDAVADRLKLLLALLPKPRKELSQKILVGEVGAAFAKATVDHRLATRPPGREMRVNPDLLDLAAEKLPQVHSGPRLPQGKLETRRSGVEGEDVAGHGRSTGRAVLGHAWAAARDAVSCGQLQFWISGMSSPYWPT